MRREAVMSAAPALQSGTSLSLVPQDLVRKLYAPLPPEAIQPHPTKDYLSSVKAIFVIERLNEVFGLGGWTYDTRVIERGKPSLVPDRRKGAAPGAMKEKPGMIVIHVALSVPAYGIRLEQFGGSDNEDRGDAYKGAVTDAISKIGSYLGIAIDVYKGGGPTHMNPRGSKVAQSQMITEPGSQAAADAVAQAKLAVLRKPQPEPQDEPPQVDGGWTYESEVEQPSELEIELHESILQDAARKQAKRNPDRFAMLREFASLHKRYKAIGFERTYYGILGVWGVEHSNQFADDEEGMANARGCYKEMSLDVSNREAKAKCTRP
jgi:hypothetical protein